MDFDTVVQRQLRVMWVGGVWFLAAFMPFFMLPWHGRPANLVGAALLLVAAYAAYRGWRAAPAGLWRHLFVSVPLLLLAAAVALAVRLA